MRAKLIFLFLSVCWWTSTRAQTECSEPGSVRVAVGVTGTAAAGRVEVCQDDVWGTVCSRSEQWSLKNAQVVCRSLGFYAAVTAIPQDSLIASLRADTSVPIHITNVECNGTENNLTQCSHSTDVSQCSDLHFNDVVVVCVAAVIPLAGDVRLLGDTADYRGAVEYYDTILGWTGVCADSSYSASWVSSRAAEIVCTQLGFQGGTPFVQSAPFLVELGVGDVECSQSAPTLAECEREAVVFSGSCGSTQAGWVECQETGLDDFSVRLLPGDREGVVEVSLNGRWGTVCDEMWISSGAQTVCDQLGVESETSASTSPSTSYSGYMSRLKPFWLSDVSCSNGDNLRECTSNTLIGYSSSCSLPTSIYDSAEANCGPPVPHRLSGGAIAGIVLAVLAVVISAVLAFIYLPERWKKRHTYSWYRTLTTPSQWCGWMKAWCQRHAPRVPRRQPRRRNVTPTPQSGGVTSSSTNQNTEYPPATVTTRQGEPSSSAVQESTQPPPQPPTSGAATGGDGVLSSIAPPPYQVAVSYPLAVAPPAYSGVPPPIGFSGPQSDEKANLPYPSAVGTDPAYPPSLQGPGPDYNLPYPS